MDCQALHSVPECDLVPSGVLRAFLNLRHLPLRIELMQFLNTGEPSVEEKNSKDCNHFNQSKYDPRLVCHMLLFFSKHHEPGLGDNNATPCKNGAKYS